MPSPTPSSGWRTTRWGVRKVSADSTGQRDSRERSRGRRPWLIPALIGGILTLLLLGGLITLIARATRPGGGEPTQAAGLPTAPVIVRTQTTNTTGRPGATRTAGTGLPVPVVTPSPVATERFFVVANTGGDGVVLRRTPGGQQLDVYQDGTRLEQIGDAREVQGVTWRHVRAPDGTEGWVSAEFTEPE